MTAEHELDIIRDSLDHCVKCTICESACPVAAVTPLFPGPKYVGPQAERFRDAGPSVDASLDYCSSCGICTLACRGRPRGGDQLPGPGGDEVSEGHAAAGPDNLPDARVQGRFGTPVAPLANFALSNRFARLLIEKFIGVPTATPRCPSSPVIPSSAGRAATPRPPRPGRSRSCTSTAAARTTSSPGWAA